MIARLFTFTGLAVFFAIGFAHAAKPDLSGNDPHWIEDPASHCWTANPTPEPGESISWTGACENRLLSGDGTLSWYLRGRLSGRDQGHFKDGELSGHGRIAFADGAVFEGEFPGQGLLTLPDGRKVEAVSVREAAGWSIEHDSEKPVFGKDSAPTIN